MDVDLDDIFEIVVDNIGTNGDEDDDHASVEVGPTDPPPPRVTGVLLLVLLLVLLVLLTGVKQSQILVFRLRLEFDNKSWIS